MSEQTVILLRKNLQDDDTGPSLAALPEASHWKALGHFDEIFIYKMGTGKLLSSIQEVKRKIERCCSSNSYYYPLFLVSDDTAADPKGFNDNHFIAVVRIHFASTLDLPGQFSKLNKKIGQLSLPHRSYYATEFSDMVLDIRGNHLNNLIDTVFHFCQDENIGKTYTYFGINTTYLNACPPAEGSGLPAGEADRLALFNIRFEQITDQAKKQMDDVLHIMSAPQSYYVSGVDDMLLHQAELSTDALVNLFRTWTQQSLYSAASSTIRVGTKMDVARVKVRKDASELKGLCNKMTTVLTFLQDRDLEQDQLWLPAIAKVANSLERMCTTPVMDEIIYLLTPAVTAFLEFHVAHPYALALEDCFRFVEDCTYFMEQLLRIESALSQKTEIRPVIYDIPVFMLEYTVAFIQKVSELLKKSDEMIPPHKKRNTVFLLVPRPCDQVCASELIAANENITGLVQLQMPEHSLYHPETFLRIVCHELSHYVGENNRQRTTRRKQFCQAAAITLARDLHSRETVTDIEREFQNALPTSGVLTMRQMRKCVQDRASELLPLFYSKAIVSADETERNYLCRGCMDLYSRQLHNMEILFRECYADICMIHILKISAADYVHMLLAELPESLAHDVLELFAIRIYAVVVGCKLPSFSLRRDEPQNVLYVARMINSIQVAIEQNRESLSLSLPVSAIYALANYSACCYQSLCDSIPEDAAGSVRKMYETITEEKPDKAEDKLYNNVLSYISDYREQLTNKQPQN